MQTALSCGWPPVGPPLLAGAAALAVLLAMPALHCGPTGQQPACVGLYPDAGGQDPVLRHRGAGHGPGVGLYRHAVWAMACSLRWAATAWACI
jgi:hypothetical protein